MDKLFNATDMQFITIFALSLITGIVLRQKYPQDIAPKIVNRMAWVFLAVLAAEAFSKYKMSLPYFVSGAIFLLFVSAVAFFFRWFRQSDDSDYLAIASGTFGGGNRGYALIMSISAWQIFSKQQQDDMITAFLQLDAMVLAWLMFVVPTLLCYKNKNTNVDFIDSIKNFAKEVGAPPLVVMGIVLLSWAFPDFVKSSVVKFLQPSHSARSALLLYLSLTYVFMMTTLVVSGVGSTIKALFIFYLPRWIAAGAAIFFVMFVFEKSVKETILNYPAILPVLVFAVCPPSNGLNNFMESFNTPSDKIAEISNLNIVTTLLFVVILFITPFLGALLP